MLYFNYIFSHCILSLNVLNLACVEISCGSSASSQVYYIYLSSNFVYCTLSPKTKEINRPFPSYPLLLLLLFQNESRCETIHTKMSFSYMSIFTHFHLNGFARRLVLKQRQRVTRKWPIHYLHKVLSDDKTK